MAVTRDSAGWTQVSYPPVDGMWFVSSSEGSDSNDGRDPNGFNLSSATYTHSTRTLTSSNAFSSYTHTGGDRTDVIYVTNVSGGIATGYYIIESKTDDSNIVLQADSGLTADGSCNSSTGPYATVSIAHANMSDGTDKQLCFKRGDTWTQENINAVDSGAEGADDTPLLYCAYGPVSLPRPKFLLNNKYFSRRQGGGSGGPIYNTYFIGFHIESFDRIASGTNPSAMNFTGIVGENILVEDCIIDGFDENISLQAPIDKFTLRRSVVVNSFADDDTGGHSQGFYAQNANYITVEDCIFDHNGWYDDYDATGVSAFQSGTNPTIYNHNIYFAEGVDHVKIARCVFSRSSNLGVKLDIHSSHMNIVDCTFVANNHGGQFGIGGVDINDTVRGNTLYIERNVWTEGQGISQGNSLGLEIQNARAGRFKDNIICNRPSFDGDSSPWAFRIGDKSDGIGIRNYDFDNNIFYDIRGRTRFDDLDVDSQEGRTYNTGVFINNTFTNNILVCPFSGSQTVFETDWVDGEITYENNTYYHYGDPDTEWISADNSIISTTGWQATYEPTASFVEPSFSDPTRTVERYATEVLGYTGGFNQLVENWKLQRNGNWDSRLHSNKINNWIKSGFDRGDSYRPIRTK